MTKLFVVGLPKAIRKKITSDAKANDIEVDCILADVDGSGRLQLVPFETDAIYAVSAYIDSLQSYSDGNILVLPYALLSEGVTEELQTLAGLGGKVTFIKGRQDGWPRFNGSPDQPFLDLLIESFATAYFPKKPPTPSEYFASLSAANPKLLITAGSLDHCDKVASHRRKFIMQCADAFADFLGVNGQIGTTIEAYFKERKLDHAQSGGINTRLRLMRADKAVYAETRNTHLKQGEKTTPQAAPRVYYHALELDAHSYIGVTYAGPHPESDIARIHHLAH